MDYREDEFLQLSGLQHFAFCRRQWALIHIEGLWAENVRTIEGEIIHERVHNEELDESRGNLLVCRGLRVYSARLGVSGQCDEVEFRQVSEGGAVLHGREGLWQPCPIEYKRGKPKVDLSDKLQLCGQAMCLEEMLCCEISEGHLFYHEIRRRERVPLTEDMRKLVHESLTEMRSYYERGYTPKPKQQKKCGNCSLKDFCLPKLSKQKTPAGYYRELLEEG